LHLDLQLRPCRQRQRELYTQQLAGDRQLRQSVRTGAEHLGIQHLAHLQRQRFEAGARQLERRRFGGLGTRHGQLKAEARHGHRRCCLSSRAGMAGFAASLLRIRVNEN
jgi:hypothetical protein